MPLIYNAAVVMLVVVITTKQLCNILQNRLVNNSVTSLRVLTPAILVRQQH